MHQDDQGREHRILRQRADPVGVDPIDLAADSRGDDDPGRLSLEGVGEVAVLIEQNPFLFLADHHGTAARRPR